MVGGVGTVGRFRGLIRAAGRRRLTVTVRRRRRRFDAGRERIQLVEEAEVTHAHFLLVAYLG